MRPRGSIRKAVADHIQSAARGATWRDLALKLEDSGLIDTRAPSELALVRRAVENMKRAGEIESLGDAPGRWSRRPLKLYGARKACPKPAAIGAIDAAMRSWVNPQAETED